jgi:hypothetical protein
MGSLKEVIAMKGKPAVMTHRVITMLDWTEMEFLDKMGNDSMFSTGHKLSYNEILKGVLDVAMETGVSGEDINCSAEFKRKVLEQIRTIMAEDAKKKEEKHV